VIRIPPVGNELHESRGSSDCWNFPGLSEIGTEFERWRCIEVGGVDPAKRAVLSTRVIDNFSGAAVARGGLAVPDGDEDVAVVHDIEPGIEVGVVARGSGRQFDDAIGAGEEGLEFGAGFGIDEIFQVVGFGEGENGFEDCAWKTKDFAGDDAVGAFGEGREGAQRLCRRGGVVDLLEDLVDLGGDTGGIIELAMAGDADSEATGGHSKADLTTDEYRCGTRIVRQESVIAVCIQAERFFDLVAAV
jgi:hypothetical protein